MLAALALSIRSIAFSLQRVATFRYVKYRNGRVSNDWRQQPKAIRKVVRLISVLAVKQTLILTGLSGEFIPNFKKG